MRNLSRWLPADTRALELPSAVGLLMVAKMLLTGALHSPVDGPHEMWAVVLAAFGLLQLVGAIKEAAPLRIVANFVVGSYWVWAGLTGDNLHPEPGDCLAVTVGVGCFYAFILHALMTHSQEVRRG